MRMLANHPRLGAIAALLAAVVLALGVARDAVASPLLYAVDSACDCLYTVRADGTATRIGVLAQDPGESYVVPTELALDLDGTIYAQNSADLLRVDRTTGDATLIRVTDGLGGMAINPVDVPLAAKDGGVLPAGSLVAIAWLPDLGATGLAVVNKTSGAIEKVLGYPQIYARIEGLAFRSDGALFGAELAISGGRLFRINPVTGGMAVIGGIQPGFGAVGAIAFDAEDNLWVSDIYNQKIWRVDDTTGATLCSFEAIFDPPVYPYKAIPQGMAFASGSPAFPSDCSRLFGVDVDLEPGVVNLSSHAPWLTAYVEATSFNPGDIDVSSVRLAGSVPAVSKSATVGDHDSDGTMDLMVKFARDAVDAQLAPGWNTLRLTGSLVTGEGFEGEDEIRVIDPPHGSISASAAPNPLNPSGVLSFSTTRPGRVRVALFNARGGLVRVLMEAPSLAAGVHRVALDGLDDHGRSLSSGVYFYRIEAAEGSVSRRVAILK